MVVGESGLGKTTFINTLFTTTIKDYKAPHTRHAKQTDRTVEIEITKAGEYPDGRSDSVSAQCYFVWNAG